MTWGKSASFFKEAFLPCCAICGILVPQPEIESTLPAVEVQSLNHWAAREVSGKCLFPMEASSGISILEFNYTHPVTCFLCQIPGLSCPICDLNCSFPKENIHLLNLPLPLHPLPGAQVPIWSSFLFPSYIMCVSFLQPCLCRSPSLGFQFSVRILPHGDVFAMWLWREVSSTSSY